MLHPWHMCKNAMPPLRMQTGSALLDPAGEKLRQACLSFLLHAGSASCHSFSHVMMRIRTQALPAPMENPSGYRLPLPFFLSLSLPPL